MKLGKPLARRAPLKRSGTPRRRKVETFACANCGAEVVRRKVGAGLCRSCAQHQNAAKAGARAAEVLRTGTVVKCEQCGKEVYRQASSSRRFCSQKCMGAAYRKTRACKVCGQEFWVPGYSTRGTCSPACERERRAENARGRKPSAEQIEKALATQRSNRAAREAGVIPPAPKRCARPGCQNPVERQATKYCSPRCHYDDRARTGMRRTTRYHRCNHCGDVFVWNGRGRGIFCSAACKRTAGQRIRREPEIVEVVRFSDHRRKDFFDDVDSCRACGGPVEHQHHVIYRQHCQRLKGDQWHPDNALALCRQCHMAIAHTHQLPLSVLRRENLAFAANLLGAYAVDHLRRYYRDDGDPRLAAMEGFSLPVAQCLAVECSCCGAELGKGEDCENCALARRWERAA